MKRDLEERYIARIRELIDQKKELEFDSAMDKRTIKELEAMCSKLN